MNKKQYLIVDGYNVINAWEDLKNMSIENLEMARDKLIDIMTEYGSFKGYIVIVVFDAYLVKGIRINDKKIKDRGIKVVYTKENETADTYIEKLINDIGKKHIIKVATSDWAQQQIVLGSGATRLSARELKLEVDIAKKKIAKKVEESKIQKNTLDSILDQSTLSKLEKIRRNH
ncbi:NYN domain-containing protein [Alkalithermobacter paradoxus]|uniref:YacP-like NYN domain protein n=1 Tax=Alkalithermobacter paradoxus TaxID=29349 RepID=A0A1V4I4M6_9FIRM|nr:YacP-like NYN domain protein [[Clostridium] thermoalcaliphilum]